MQRGVPHYRDFVCSAASAALAARLRASLRPSVRRVRPRWCSPEPAPTPSSACIRLSTRACTKRLPRPASMTRPCPRSRGGSIACSSGLGQKDVHIRRPAGARRHAAGATDGPRRRRPGEVERAGGPAGAGRRRRATAQCRPRRAGSAQRRTSAAGRAGRAPCGAPGRARTAVAALQQEAAGVRGAIAERDATVRARDEELLALRAHATAVRRELEATRGSRTWWATAPLRAAGQKARAAKQWLSFDPAAAAGAAAPHCDEEAGRPVHRCGGAVRWRVLRSPVSRRGRREGGPAAALPAARGGGGPRPEPALRPCLLRGAAPRPCRRGAAVALHQRRRGRGARPASAVRHHLLSRAQPRRGLEFSQSAWPLPQVPGGPRDAIRIPTSTARSTCRPTPTSPPRE